MPTGNLFIDQLPHDVGAALKPSLERVDLASGTLIYEQDAPLQSVYFPIDCILSNVLQMSNGGMAEVGIVGREGMSGLVLALGQRSSNQRTLAQVPGSSQRMPAADFVAALEEFPQLKAAALRFGQATLMASAQLSACNGLHQVNERCARWLLMAHDRIDGDTIWLTQEFLSQMLGVRRGGVTLAASTMQRAGYISYSRGRITMLDRESLESATCECYADVERHWKAIMGYSVTKHR